ncbi:KTSC domain-containing protein [Mesorhizobium sp. L2C085B000]|uniref:KTSC domain-containing protein n=1 Tax=Mesorhizobium sp. L2C085B000 TaxID=1287117 RepID=UPI0009DCC104|nr:KTSC domain-containing protein [Mesorhizobium sp. L2C085B000]
MPSTSIRKFDYDPNTRVLSVWFVASGKHYEFLDVPAEAVAEVTLRTSEPIWIRVADEKRGHNSNTVSANSAS